MKNLLFLSVVLQLLLTTYAAAEWVTPSKKTCLKKAGSINSEGQCETNLANAKRICKSMGGKLPTRTDLYNAMKRCGGKPGSIGNKRNRSYQSCYKKEGFGADSLYWSSSSFYGMGGTNNRVWYVSFSHANSYASSSSSSAKKAVRCLKK